MCKHSAERWQAPQSHPHISTTALTRSIATIGAQPIMMATVALRPSFSAFRPATSGRRSSGRRLQASQGQDNGSGGNGPVVSEDVLQRLRQAEEEAARLKKELAAAQAAVRMP